MCFCLCVAMMRVQRLTLCAPPIKSTVSKGITRGNANIQIGVFLILAAVGFSAERINEHCALNYEDIATQQYFDHHGFFTSMVLCMPILLNLIFLTVRKPKMRKEVLCIFCIFSCSKKLLTFPPPSLSLPLPLPPLFLLSSCLCPRLLSNR